MKPTVRLRHTTWLASAVLGTTQLGCGEDYTCYDLANCPLEPDAGLDSTTSGDAHTESSTPTEGGPTTPESSPTASESSPTASESTRPAGSSRETSTSRPEPTPSASSQGTQPESDACEADSSCECEDGETIDCWELPDGTPISDDPEDAIGDCRLGKKACTNGTWSACEGAVAPEATDACDRPLADNNCDGVPNEGCTCTPNETRTCGTDVGPCETGIQTCGSNGQWEAACEGESPPAAADRCDTVNDDNCNDNPNDDCECVGSEVEACNDCGQKTCNPDTGRWGACEPAEDRRCNEDGSGIDVCDSDGNWEYSECDNADATNCSVECDTVVGSPTCVVSAKDTDGDGYTSAACTEAPGNDCDDSRSSVNPDAIESCDGRDNDCDGFVDALDSTINLSGSPTSVNRSSALLDVRRIDLTWSGNEFFVVADARETFDGNTAIFSGYARTNGSAALYSSSSLNANADTMYDTPRISSSSGKLGGFARMDGRGYGARFFTLSNTGELLTDVSNDGWPLGDVVPSGNGFSLVTVRRSTTVSDFNTFYFASGSSAGAVTPVRNRADIPGYIEHINAAQQGQTTGVTYTDTSQAQPSVQLLRGTSDSIVGPLQLAQPARNGDIAALSNGNFAVAWATAEGFKLQVRGSSANLICDSGTVTFGDGVLDELDAVAITETDLGLLVIATDSSGTTGRAEVFVLDGSCEVRSEQPKPLFNRTALAYQGDIPQLPRVAVGGGYVGFAWTAQSLDQYRSYVRVVPQALCQ